MTRILAEDPPSRLTKISYGQFYNLVENDVRRRLDATIAKKLRDAQVVPRWILMLRRMRATIDSSTVAKTAEARATRLSLQNELQRTREQIRKLHSNERSGEAPEATVEELRQRTLELRVQINEVTITLDNWRKDSVRFRNAVGERLTEAMWLHQSAVGDSFTADERVRRLNDELSETRKQYNRVVQAVRRHQGALDPLDATDHDEALWATLPPEYS